MAKRFSVIADAICDALLDLGFTVHRYDAFSTSSIYLKLDYGAAGSIRISDHEGYKHLSYMWNIGPWIDREKHWNHKVRPRHFYPSDMAGEMLDKICELRDARKEAGDYDKRIDMGKLDKKSAISGFWAHPETHEVKRSQS